MTKIYRGKRCEPGVEVCVLVIDIRKRTRVRTLRHIPFHSPAGFEWGYQGSGPADLALAILVDYFRERPPRTGWLAGQKFSRWTVDSTAFTHHQDFKREIVARFGDEWELDGVQIDTWLKDRP
jgi:hypothetical protein